MLESSAGESEGVSLEPGQVWWWRVGTHPVLTAHVPRTTQDVESREASLLITAHPVLSDDDN